MDCFTNPLGIRTLIINFRRMKYLYNISAMEFQELVTHAGTSVLERTIK